MPIGRFALWEVYIAIRGSAFYPGTMFFSSILWMQTWKAAGNGSRPCPSTWENWIWGRKQQVWALFLSNPLLSGKQTYDIYNETEFITYIRASHNTESDSCSNVVINQFSKYSPRKSKSTKFWMSINSPRLCPYSTMIILLPIWLFLEVSISPN